MRARTRAFHGACAVVTAVAGLCGGPAWSREAPRLETIVRGGAGPTTLVLLHGLRSSAAEWEQFDDALAPGSACRLVFPQGPDVVAGHAGEAHGRAWWRLKLESYVPAGATLPDLSRARPAGLLVAADSVRGVLNDLSAPPARAPVLGGFSQGAMVAAEVAFTSDEPLSALVLLSVTPVDEAAWRRGFAARRDVPIFMAHGRRDRSLSFAAARRLRREMVAAGLDVTWLPFDGGHEIPSVVVEGLNQFLVAKGLAPAPAAPGARSGRRPLAKPPR